jgi:hypothetical protein
MFSKNLPSLLSISTILFTAMAVGIFQNPGRPKVTLFSDLRKQPTPLQEQIAATVPSIGRIQVLNGCGVEGAADKMTDFLRAKKFNVTNTGNAPSWNYQFTLIISHIKDLTIARQIAAALTTDHIVLIRKDDRTYDVTVVIGPDYGERIR